ncbi:arginine deiminase family protein [Hoeflea sp. G2-23]|uniref:Arginine deiminase family protein n=1 Tax=Hoeflea algicola TaxID=2983763 RepID=A0ABT3Z6W2_9HYPH|nr:arginine deiminase family protein [Hoeflea algicola]MCY0147449.1 arginine deiminase family protein [Hoeflea algicola]
MSADLSGQARLQHAELVRVLGQEGVRVRYFDELLASALGFADARDWVLERRVGECVDDAGRVTEISTWLSERPVDVLADYLVNGMQVSDLPSELSKVKKGAGGEVDWVFCPLYDLGNLRRHLRVLGGNVVIAQPLPAARRPEAITVSAVLNFAPLFDDANFEFWPTSDGADCDFPAIDGRDLAILGCGDIFIGAITRATSVTALSALTAALFQQNAVGHAFWVDLTGPDGRCLDDCLVALAPDCVIVDGAVLEQAEVFRVYSAPRGEVLRITACDTAFLRELCASFSGGLNVIDASHYPGAVGRSLAGLSPIVLAPGHILAFAEHEPAFEVLEQYGVTIACALNGSALAHDCKGPRGLVTALLAGPAPV